MALRLRYNEDFSKGIKRLIINECKTALEFLRVCEDENSRHKAVHETRKSFKKIRACLRLIRDQIDFYKTENRWFRDQGRKISGIRDSTANLEALELLRGQYDTYLKSVTFRQFENELRVYRKQLANQIFHKENRLSEIRRDIECKVDEVAGWDFGINTFHGIESGLRRTYKRGYKGIKRAENSESIEDFHEWRKRVKYIRYQIDVLNRIRPKIMASLEDELHDITDLTGTMHDLHNLQVIARRLDQPFSNQNEKILFHALAEKYQQLMLKHALVKGRKFYKNSPEEFCSQLEVYWNMHEKEVKDDHLPPLKNLQF